MTLSEAVEALAAQPASLQARAMVATELGRMGVPFATAVWMATINAASARGHFFAALALIRRRLTGKIARKALVALADRYGAAAPSGRRAPPPRPAPREVVIPAERAALVELAIELGTDLTGVLPPEGSGVPQVPLFRALRGEAFVALAEAVVEVPLTSGTVLVRQGQVEPALFLLAQGTAAVRQQRPDGEQVELAQVSAPALIGEIALLTAVPRRASVVAVGRGLAWRVDAEVLRSLGARHPALAGQLAELVKSRLLANLVRQSAVLQQVKGLDALFSSFQLLTVPPRTEVIAQGAPPPGLFLVLHGSAEVWAEAEDGVVRVAVLTEGDAFGEMSLLSGEPTSAAVRMADGGVLLHLSVAAYAACAGEVSGLSEELEALADVRRGELTDLVEPLDDDFEVVDESWLIE